MGRSISSFKQGSGGKEDKEWLGSGNTPELVDSPDAYIYDRDDFPLSLSTVSLALPQGASIIEPPHCHKPFMLPALCPKKEWPVISMVKFNPIHLNMHRQGPVGTRASFITAQLLLLLPCIVVYVCVCGISPDLSWRRQGKMMGAQRDRQSNRAFKPTSDSVRLWFFSPPTLFFPVCYRQEKWTAVAVLFRTTSSALTGPTELFFWRF